MSVIVKRRGRSKIAGPVVHDDLVQGRFQAASLDRAWFTDITEQPTSEGKLYVCAIKDACSNRIVGLSMGPRMTWNLACNALRYPVAARSPIGTIVRPDRRGRFRSRAFATTLRNAGLRGSMRQVASAADNAAMESFYALLRKNVLNVRRWDTREELRLAILTWIEPDYRRRRRQAALGRPIHIAFETIHNAATRALIERRSLTRFPGQFRLGDHAAVMAAVCRVS